MAEPLAARIGAMETLRAEVRSMGCLERPTGRFLLELLFTLVVCVGGAVVAIRADGWGLRALGMLVSTAGTLGVATNIHTASHGAISRHEWVNQLVAYLGYPFFLNLSLTSWWRTHIALHHRVPNVLGVDGDIKLMPLFAVTIPEYESARGAVRAYRRVQWLALLLLLPLDAPKRMWKGWSFLLSQLRDPTLRKTEHWIDMAAMSGYWVAWVGVPMLFYPPWQVLAFTGVRVGLIGFALFAAFAPGHMPAEAECFTPESRPTDFFERQLRATVNFRSGPLRQFFLGGLQFQIEHHLFPSVTHVHYPRLRPLVMRFAKEQGYPYREFGWPLALWKAFDVFIHPKPVTLVGDKRDDAESRPETMSMTAQPACAPAADIHGGP